VEQFSAVRGGEAAGALVAGRLVARAGPAEPRGKMPSEKELTPDAADDVA
jgi:hypothetical protein